MRKVSCLIGLVAVTLAGSARAQEEAPAAAPAAEPAAAPAADNVAAPAATPAAAASASKMQLGLNLLPMFLGKTKTDLGDADLKIAYGVGVSFGYQVIPGLSVGVAPQALFNVKAKDGDADAAKQYDLMARVAYTYAVIPNLGVYAEVLPGYSIISPKSGDSSKGFALAGGVGALYDLNEQLYLNLSVGYEYGMQKVNGAKFGDSFLRIGVGAGVKL